MTLKKTVAGAKPCSRERKCDPALGWRWTLEAQAAKVSHSRRQLGPGEFKVMDTASG